MYSIAFMLYHAQGVAQDYKTALSWYVKVAQLGDADAMYQAGCMYSEGIGTQTDYAQARYWLEMAIKFAEDDADLQESAREELARISS